MRWNHVQTDPLQLPQPTQTSLRPTPFRPLGEAGGHPVGGCAADLRPVLCGRPMGAWSEDCGGTLFTEHPVLLLRLRGGRPLLFCPDGAGRQCPGRPGGFLRHCLRCPAHRHCHQPARRLLPLFERLALVTGTVTQWGCAFVR